MSKKSAEWHRNVNKSKFLLIPHTTKLTKKNLWPLKKTGMLTNSKPEYPGLLEISMG